MKFKNSKLTILSLLLLLALIIPNSAFARSWAYETAPGLPTGSVSSPLFGSNITAAVSSSWNEPRNSISAPHKGVDQSVSSGSNVGAMWNQSRVLSHGYDSSGGGYWQVIRSYNDTTATTFYSIGFHLSNNSVIADGTAVTLSDVTAYSGNSGSSSGPHLHWEILNYWDEGTNSVGTRTSVNPINYSNLTMKSQFSVFKNLSVSQNAGSGFVSIAIDGIDYNLGSPDNLTIGKLYYKSSTSSTWSGPVTMNVSNGHFTYTMSGIPYTTYNFIIAGQRNSSEYWSTYPAKHDANDVGTTSPIPINNLTGWDYFSGTF